MRLHFLALSCTAALLGSPAVFAVTKQETAARQDELKDLRGQMTQIRKELASTEANRAEAADALKESESAISEANRVLGNLASERQLSEQELARLNSDISRTRQSIDRSRQRLAELLRTRYKAGNVEAWRLLLDQQDPNQVSRNLGYLRYLSLAQQQLAERLAQQLDELNALAEEIRLRNEALQQLAREQALQKTSLLEQQARKQALLRQLSQRIDSQRNQLEKLQADEKRLTALVDRLNALLKKQEADRVREAARRKAEAEKRAREQALAEQKARQSGKPVPPRPAVQPQQVDELPDSSQAAARFAALKGKLRLPAKGSITGRFGSSRGEGGSWKGVFIQTAGGVPVHAVATGRVVFAEWLRGFGNLIIVDHGGGYMSLYGANESLLKQVGDPVSAGDAIATSGNSGGMGETGVYFEIRQNGRPLDPMSWAG
ncbi:peptidoglycan DD-metalloendopeptidase family protein [Chitinilyticum piscinae]|uniref:Peptidoglycan DD-metalloendopeptidase family protein n=1 Tax=Chitinilyticum piscinae TaxID=2866724 RepID=A0A8J7FKU7_9NEIS|nr:peptidoglycan DD-metalloendopeptidase family protein [Chitinilyticum piscinae]MBE9609887.1 peptidoglycan DD-metalloendopeptidase family protein [Chitinilyticum piscinae]